MDEDAPMDLADDRFDDQFIQDEPVEDGDSFYDADGYLECEEDEEEVVPTSENFRVESRYKPSQHTPRELPTIREENREDLRSSTSSRINTRPPSVLSDKSNDISNQFGFQDAGRAIDQYTDQFFSDGNRAERLFPEADLVNKGMSPARDKQHSWEPSVCHYEKQPTPEVHNNSPGLIFGNLNSKKEPLKKQENVRTGKMIPEKVNDENGLVNRRLSPERNAFATSPMNSTKFLEEKTSTPKRPGGNRIGTRLPNFDYSTIYDISPQRASGTPKNNYQSRHPTNPITPSTVSNSDTVLSNRTVGENTVLNVLSGNLDDDLMAALENARKKREKPVAKPDFRLNQSRLKASTSQRPKLVDNSSLASTNSTSLHRKATESQRHSSIATDLTNSNTTNMSTSSRISTAKSDFTRTSRQHGGFSDSSVSTVIPNMNSMTTRDRDGRDSVSSIRTVSRASSTMTLGGNAVHSMPGTLKPLRIHTSRLAFGYVPTGETLTMQLEVENVSDRSCQVHACFDRNSTKPYFQLLDNETTMVDPKKSIKIRVAFTPTSLGRYSIYLKIEVPTQNFTQMVSVWGFGGNSKVAPIPAQDLRPTSSSSEFAMYSFDMRRISFRLGNSGTRSGFALLVVYDSSMRPVPSDYVRFSPSQGVVIGRNSEKRIEVRIDSSYVEHYDEFASRRASSAMSSVSTATTATSMTSLRRRGIPGTDFVIQVAWGVEGIRERLRMLEIQNKCHKQIDGLDFTSHAFTDEKPDVYPPPNGFPKISNEDSDLFASSYNSFYINIFPSPSGLNAFRAATVISSATNNDATLLETSAFRHNTFVNDVTVVPRPKKRM